MVGEAFYRPHSTLARDLAVLVATLENERLGRLRVLDAMTGSGVRPLRYLLEAGADWVWANEGNPDLTDILKANLAQVAPTRYRITHDDAQAVLFRCYQERDFYDLVDIDNFGSPAPHTSNALWATKIGGLLYLTSTDARSTSGHDPERSLKIYGASARSHPAVHEQGLRLLIGHAAQTAAARGLGIQPVFSLFTGQVHRAMVRLVKRPTLSSETYGFLAYCHRCGQFQTVAWRKLGQVACPECQGQPQSSPLSGSTIQEQTVSHPSPPILSGPMWLGDLHHVPTLEAMATLAQDWGWSSQVKVLNRMMAEVTLPPYYYPLGEVGRRGQMDIPNRDQLIAALQNQGYRATVPSCDPQAVKTDAPLTACLAFAKGLEQAESPPY
ncbi:MAG: tRNA ((26)-N(2)/guanine(27)-N(2))-dimethyltransferase [Cyanobacteriota bacterium]|jgi:tRNA (guanine26-N2/guanine27-N2)-dimethyltransferase